MSGRFTLYLLLLVVAGAAAMLSFAALRDLALRCGFAPLLAWMLPVVVDAGAAAGSLVWLGERAGERARRFARRLALGLLGLSVAANALGHGLAAFVLLPPWWVVVVLSGIAPAVLGAMVHLAVLVGRPEGQPTEAPAALDEPAQHESVQLDGPPAEPDLPAVREPVLSRSDREQDTGPGVAGQLQHGTDPDGIDRTSALIAAGAGRAAFGCGGGGLPAGCGSTTSGCPSTFRR